MSIEILPARLANQIAAGEVVERPASVIKELMENSLDAGATQIHIEVEKGGSKKLRISDNGSGIVKDELTLALSRHATSKIKTLNDLESISSLGFRGEALASISSVSRLTITSKPASQENAWQANASGRDMEVTLQPAAHPNGTTIEVKDLFFNTPARRKFLRTDKTEFAHIDEVVRRIALARFDVSFSLIHNGKMVRQYRAAKDKSQYAKRVAMVCGKSFIDHALEVDCQHGNLHLWGWLAQPSFARSQNDLCYSYVNGRMMRDKLINHAIRQAYAERLVGDDFPAFVLFLEIDHREVDVNVHPAKHEVRFHQGRYVHDFIFTVCNDTLAAQLLEQIPEHSPEQVTVQANIAESQPQASNNLELSSHTGNSHSTEQQNQHQHEQAYQQREQFVQPLAQVNDAVRHQGYVSVNRANPPVSKVAQQNYQQLMTPYQESECSQIHHFIDSGYGVISVQKQLRLLSFAKLAQCNAEKELNQRWEKGLVSQPLLLPVMLPLSKEQLNFVQQYLTDFEHIGMVFQIKNNHKIQIRQFPAMLRDKDISLCLITLLDELMLLPQEQKLGKSHWCKALSLIMVADNYTIVSAQILLNQAQKNFEGEFEAQLLLNSVVIDLTSQISQLT